MLIALPVQVKALTQETQISAQEARQSYDVHIDILYQYAPFGHSTVYNGVINLNVGIESSITFSFKNTDRTAVVSILLNSIDEENKMMDITLTRQDYRDDIAVGGMSIINFTHEIGGNDTFVKLKSQDPRNNGPLKFTISY